MRHLSLYLIKWYYPPVSISDEKPLHMRLILYSLLRFINSCFNLRREAAPHATKEEGDLVRHSNFFNLRREAAPHATDEISGPEQELGKFQSQTRSRSTCDIIQ